MEIHPVFHVSKLAPYVSNEFNQKKKLNEMPPIIINEEEHYEVEAILDSKFMGKKLKYRVSFLGYDSTYDLWLPEDNLDGCKRLIKEYHEKFPNKPRPRNMTKSKVAMLEVEESSPRGRILLPLRVIGEERSIVWTKRIGAKTRDQSVESPVVNTRDQSGESSVAVIGSSEIDIYFGMFDCDCTNCTNNGH